MVTESSPHMDSSPLAIANRHYNTNNQLVQNTRYRLILAKASNFDWLTRDRDAMRDLTAVAKEGSHHWVPIQDLPFDEIILIAYAADHSSRPTYVCLPSGLYHARSGRILQQSGPNQEVMPLPGIYFFDAWRVRPCMDIPTDLPRTQDPNMIPSSQRQLLPLLNHKHRTKKPETYLPRQLETRLKMDPAHGGQQFEHISTCMPWSVNTAHSSRRYMRPPKNTPHAAKAPRNPSNAGLNRKNSLLSHRNSRLSCYTACPPCLTPGPWLKSPSTWTRQVNGFKKWEDFFADERVQRPGDFFFSSRLADVALRLGPYMSISSQKDICTRTQ